MRRLGFDVILVSFDTSNSDRLPDPYLTHQVRLFPARSPRQSSTDAAVGGLEPSPAGRLRRAYLHLPCSTTSRSSPYIELPSSFGTQLNGHPGYSWGSVHAVAGSAPVLVVVFPLLLAPLPVPAPVPVLVVGVLVV
jgi:hypothetical protein